MAPGRRGRASAGNYCRKLPFVAVVVAVAVVAVVAAVVVVAAVAAVVAQRDYYYSLVHDCEKSCCVFLVFVAAGFQVRGGRCRNTDVVVAGRKHHFQRVLVVVVVVAAGWLMRTGEKLLCSVGDRSPCSARMCRVPPPPPGDKVLWRRGRNFSTAPRASWISRRCVSRGAFPVGRGVSRWQK